MPLDDLIDKSVICPICSSPFKTKKVRRSRIKVKKRWPDYYTEYNGENPTFYGVIVCPVCGYSAFESDFLDIDKNGIDIIAQAIGINWKGKNYCDMRDIKQAIEAHKLALLGYDLRKYKNSSIGKVALRLSWFYRELNDEKNEIYFKKIALDKFRQAFSEERLDDNKDEELTIMYLIGDMLRQIGEYKEAVQWYDRVLKDPECKKKRHLMLRVRDQWILTSDLYKKSKEVKDNDLG